MKLGGLDQLKSLSIDVGSVFVMTLYGSDGITPKDGEESRRKMFVVLGKNKTSFTVASVLINSDINAHKFNMIGPYQHEIRGDAYDFLSKDVSYVDGYVLFEFPISRIQDNAEYLGLISEEDLKQIIAHVKESPAIQPRLISQYNL